MSFKSIAVSSSILAAFGFGPSAFAQDSGFYVQGHGGASFVVQDDADLTVDGLGSVSGNYDTDTGYVVGGAFGKSYANGLRSDVELARRSNQLTGFEAGGESLDADYDLTSLAIMLNGYYDFATPNASLVPYIGGGLGYADVEVEDESEGTFAYQLKAGLGRKLENGGTFGAEASWFATPELEFADEGLAAEFDYGSTALQLFYRQAI